MNIVVCIKQVPDTTEVKINPVTGTLIREGVPSIMNPDDKGGLEYALQLKDKYGAHVTVITMGLPQAEAILREALAMGVDRAILLTDRKLGGADTLATSSALAGALRTMDVDLIITGRQAIDGDTAQVGPQIAEHLDLPQVSYMEDLQDDAATKTFTIKKQLEDGYQVLDRQRHRHRLRQGNRSLGRRPHQRPRGAHRQGRLAHERLQVVPQAAQARRPDLRGQPRRGRRTDCQQAQRETHYLMFECVNA